MQVVRPQAALPSQQWRGALLLLVLLLLLLLQYLDAVRPLSSAHLGVAHH
jgi:hypothetical protein